MTYYELKELIDSRIENGVKPALSEEEAKEYLGEENVAIIDMMFDYCDDMEYDIYAHETDFESAENIINNGYGDQETRISSEEFFEKTGIKRGSKFQATEYDEDGVGTMIVNRDRQENLFYSGILGDGQHFLKQTAGKYNLPSYVSFVDAMVNRSASGAKCIALVPKSLTTEQTEHTEYCAVQSHYDEFTDETVPYQYYTRDVVDKEFFMGYFDIKNKKFVLNENFEFLHRVEDQFSLAFTDREPFHEWFEQQLKRQEMDKVMPSSSETISSNNMAVNNNHK